MKTHIYRASRTGGIVAGDEPRYTLSTPGGTIEITDKNDIQAIDKAIEEAKRMKVDINGYLNYMVNEENIIGLIGRRNVWDDVCTV